MLVVSPFFGINFILAVLKIAGRLPFSSANFAHSKSGLLKMSQKDLINLYEKPSGPGALLKLDCSRERSSSRISSSESRFLFSVSESMLDVTIGCPQITYTLR